MEQEKNDVELDLPPEYCHYRDDGCEFADNLLHCKASCLSCPFPNCVYDEPRGGHLNDICLIRI
jgi:hypothetical protein